MGGVWARAADGRGAGGWMRRKSCPFLSTGARIRLCFAELRHALEPGCSDGHRGSTQEQQRLVAEDGCDAQATMLPLAKQPRATPRAYASANAGLDWARQTLPQSVQMAAPSTVQSASPLTAAAPRPTTFVGCGIGKSRHGRVLHSAPRLRWPPEHTKTCQFASHGPPVRQRFRLGPI